LAKFKIVFEREKCIGCGTCAALCSENWELEGDKSKPKKLELDEVGCNKDAEQNCPVNCIHVEER
tara:strand:- start:1324 stop:1518 length:195 start_codon:yes stop_codon:yes gene_type:complete